MENYSMEALSVSRFAGFENEMELNKLNMERLGERFPPKLG
ncbi:hypothetical protein B4119_0007 [Parageobacillus caldoxylosilyticus]|uniref:Uncharacterized protein n=1 Tax=Saccharococcus caldoxylosilyticus TaxID=81408 RepID=A0A150LH98_9BACL|nr:hypothetical protein B4119_0007 [Parageobacillus caldoxylosilyticus]